MFQNKIQNNVQSIVQDKKEHQPYSKMHDDKSKHRKNK